MANKGDFVWYELLTTDVQGAIAFYTDVVGWKTQPFGEGSDYTMWVGDQGPLGGLSLLPEQAKKMGAPTYWQANVVVTDVDAAVAKVKELGGKILVSEDVPTVGKFAVIQDPQGAVISLFSPASNMPLHDATKPGEFAWNELYARNQDEALRFYQAIVGWEKLGELPIPPMGTYVLYGHAGRQLGGIMTLPPGIKTPDGRDVPPSWMHYITVADFDAALERAKARGAKVLNGPMPVPGGQRVVQLMDPQGGAFALTTPPV
ncbi:MAG: VOC family protein [Kofleriaceae bacterium]|nr:VOC family protein [Kofleriaceae bacterium]